DWLQREVRKRGMEIALDFAINCSPDHPYVREHPDWFYQRPDGSIKFAENPPKKYEDIFPLNFRCEKWPELWAEMVSIVLFVAEHSGYFAVFLAGWRASGLHRSGGASRDPLAGLRHLQRIRALRERSVARARGVSRFGKIPIQRA